MKIRVNLQKKPICFLLGVFTIWWLSGCMPIQRISPTHGRKKSYALKTLYTTPAGQPMITMYNTDIFPAYRARYTYQPPYIYIMGNKLREKMPPITPEQKWRVFYRKPNGNYIIYSEEYNSLAGTEKIPIGIEIEPDGALADKEAWKHTDTPVKKAVQPLWEVPEPRLFEKTEDLIKEGSFKAELIYKGKEDNIITLSYAEPASSRGLMYDLSKGNVIEFKSLLIKIVEVTDTNISFEVIKEGSLSWVPKYGYSSPEKPVAE